MATQTKPTTKTSKKRPGAQTVKSGKSTSGKNKSADEPTKKPTRKRAKAAKSKASDMTAEDIRERYLDKLLSEGQKPASMYKFASDIGISEAEFYTHFTTFDALEEQVWTDLMDSTLDTLEDDEHYKGFSAREKLLAFFYTHLEVLKAYRSFAQLRVPDLRSLTGTPSAYRSYKKRFEKFARTLVAEAIGNGEIAPRPFLSDRYPAAFWVQLVFVLNFWTKDGSPGFERSDAAVEKAVNLSFQLLGDTTPDSVVDFVKFLWQSR